MNKEIDPFFVQKKLMLKCYLGSKIIFVSIFQTMFLIFFSFDKLKLGIHYHYP
jgi:hypothetical protein